VAVTYEAEDLTTISAACARGGTDAGLLVCVKARGLVRIGEGRLAFGHPLTPVLYTTAPAPRRTLRGRWFEVTTDPADVP